MFLYDASHVTILRIQALVLLHLIRYARCTTRGREARDNGVEPEDGVGGPIPKMEGPMECMPGVEDVPQDGAS